MIKKELECLLCGKWFNHLGSHVAKTHHMLAREYKMHFGLSIKTPLISQEIKYKKQIRFEEDREKFLENLTKGKNYRFKKGHYKKTYYSHESIDKAVEQLNVINSRQEAPCPFCNIKFSHIESHIYNKHGFLYMKKK